MHSSTHFDDMKTMLKAEVKAEVKAELAAEFDKELAKLRRDFEGLRTLLRVPPEDDDGELQNVALHQIQEEESEEETRDYTTWRGFEKCLQQQSVRILKGSWLLKMNAEGRRVERRQELPEDVFWTPENALKKIRERAGELDSKFLFVLSYRWLQRGHPDPHRHHLSIICTILSLAKQAFGDVGLFWDFLSLCQPDDDNIRTEEEKESFNKGLQAANILYAHRLSVVVVQPVMPLNFTGPSYEWSGWCHFESVVSNLIKPWDQRLNVQLRKGDEKTYRALCDNCKVSRSPPVSPATFKAQLEKRCFTNARTDADIVVKLYTCTFASLAARTEELDFSHLLWCLPQATVLSRALPQFTKCSSLDVSRNPFGTHGVVVLMNGISKMPQLRTLLMKRCRGLEVAANVPKWCFNLEQMKNLELLDVSENAFDELGFAALAKYICFKLRVDGSAAELKNAGFNAEQLMDAGFNLQQLRDAGFDARQLSEAGISAWELQDAGFSLQLLNDAGLLKFARFNAWELRDAGLSAEQLKDAGFSAEHVKDAGLL